MSALHPTPTERKVTRSEWFAGAACVISAGSLVFSAGFVYGQTQENTRRITAVEGKVDPAVVDISSMKTSIDYLVAAERARQQRNGR